MKPYVLGWLALHDLPALLLPGYGAMVGLATLLAASIVLGATRREGGDVRGTATTLLLAYLGALGGGYVYEWIRVTPEALAALSIEPYLHVGRAAYGGLIFASLAALLHLRRRGAPIGAFFDRCALSLGVVFALVRAGCFLEGCDYGAVTEGPLGVHYPPGSIAALDHVARGWIGAGAPSLPVHPTQLYEGAVALTGSALALALYRRARRGELPSGVPFAAWLAVYAVGRAAVEVLRADAGRGIYLGLSSAQWTSIGILALAAAIVARRGVAPRGGADALA